MGPVVGLVVNPSASRDIRRLTSLARTVDVHERVNQTARILQGLSACARIVPGGLGPVRYMPEACRVVERAYAEIAHAGLDAHSPGPRLGPAAASDARAIRRLVVEAVVLPGSETADDAHATARAAAALAHAGARCIVTVGGDGTNRAVARGWPEAVLCAVPGGTNNAFAPALDPVTAGLAAGLFAIDPDGAAGHTHACSRLDVRAGAAAESFALVDVAVVRGAWIGAHAVWDPETLVEVVVTRADPTVSGLAGLAGMVRPLAVDTTGDPPRAVHLRLGAADSDATADGTADNDTTRGGPPDDGLLDLPQTVLAPLGPGHLVPVVVRSWRALGAGDAVRLGPYPERVTLAFDGEREIVVEPGTPIVVRLARSPLRLLDGVGLLRSLSEQGALLVPQERRGSGAGRGLAAS